MTDNHLAALQCIVDIALTTIVAAAAAVISASGGIENETIAGKHTKFWAYVCDNAIIDLSTNKMIICNDALVFCS